MISTVAHCLLDIRLVVWTWKVSASCCYVCAFGCQRPSHAGGEVERGHVPYPHAPAVEHDRHSVDSDGQNDSEVEQDDEDALEPRDRRGIFGCPFPGCWRTFNHAVNKTLHIRRKHTFEKPHKCDFPGCDKVRL